MNHLRYHRPRHMLSQALAGGWRTRKNARIKFSLESNAAPTDMTTLVVTSRMFITACKAVNYRVILTQLVTF